LRIAGKDRRCRRVVRGPHGHEKVGEEILRVRCHNCGNRVSLDPGQDEARCPRCNALVKRPKQK
jgi:DNA-directed RNA polymerase subunit RPC12/RpoP